MAAVILFIALSIPFLIVGGLAGCAAWFLWKAMHEADKELRRRQTGAVDPKELIR